MKNKVKKEDINKNVIKADMKMCYTDMRKLNMSHNELTKMQITDRRNVFVSSKYISPRFNTFRSIPSS